MSKPISGLFVGTRGSRERPQTYNEKEAASEKPREFAACDIRFSQTSVSDSSEIVESMQEHGWIGEPVDIVVMEDGLLTTLDNTRVAAARQAGVNVIARVHQHDELLPNAQMVERFSTRHGTPTTWGQAVKLRIGKQRNSFKKENPLGSYDLPTLR